MNTTMSFIVINTGRIIDIIHYITISMLIENFTSKNLSGKVLAWLRGHHGSEDTLDAVINAQLVSL
jgi:hypothetical protein